MSRRTLYDEYLAVPVRYAIVTSLVIAPFLTLLRWTGWRGPFLPIQSISFVGAVSLMPLYAVELFAVTTIVLAVFRPWKRW
jgi:hypothetical protein